MKIVEIVPVLQDGKLVYPATITNAVVDPRTGRLLSDILKEAGYGIVVDEDIDPESENPVQNKAIYVKLEEKASKVEDLEPVEDRVEDLEEFASEQVDLSLEEVSLICPI